MRRRHSAWLILAIRNDRRRPPLCLACHPGISLSVWTRHYCLLPTTKCHRSKVYEIKKVSAPNKNRGAKH
jgi:hypothetical protein